MNNRTRRLLLRRALLAVMLSLAGIIQNTLLASLRPGVWLLIPATVVIAVHEKEFAGMFYGVLAGAFWDMASPAPDGMYALCFAVLACICGLLAKRVFRSTLPAAMLLCLLFSAAISLAALVYTAVCAGLHGLISAVLRYYLPSVLLTTLVLPLLYYPVKRIEQLLHTSASVLD